MLLKFRMVCVSGYCALGCHGSCVHNKQIDHTLYGNFSKLPCKYVLYVMALNFFPFIYYIANSIFFFQPPAAFVLPSREALCLGDRVIMYLPRCADTNSDVRKISAQVCTFAILSLVKICTTSL